MERWRWIDRVLLVNQLKILEQVDPEEAEGLASWREALERGYEGEYSNMFSEVYGDDDVLSKDACEEV